MYDMIASIELTELSWSSNWNGYEVGYPKSEIVEEYTQERKDGRYIFYIDIKTKKVLDFWKEEEGEWI